MSGVPGVQSSTAQVTVQVQPQPPVILNGDVLEIMEDSSVDIKCKSRQGKPPATIKWYDTSDKEIEKDEEAKNIVDETEDIDNSKVQNQISIVKLDIKKNMNGGNLTCEASHPTYAEGSVKTVIQVKVQYKPTLIISQEPGDIKEGDTVIVKCDSQSNPPAVTFKWYIDDIIEYEKVKDDDLSDQSSSLEISGIDKDMNGKKVKCWASNDILNKPYETEEVHTLNVHCKYIIQ